MVVWGVEGSLGLVCWSVTSPLHSPLPPPPPTLTPVPVPPSSLVMMQYSSPCLSAHVLSLTPPDSPQFLFCLCSFFSRHFMYNFYDLGLLRVLPCAHLGTQCCVLYYNYTLLMRTVSGRQDVILPSSGISNTCLGNVHGKRTPSRSTEAENMQ